MTHPTVFLVDNGSLRPESVLSLRRVAAALEERTGRTVQAAALLYSHEIPAGKLDGKAAESLEAAIRRRCAAGEREFCILPFFFGPSNVMTVQLPEKMRILSQEIGEFFLKIAPPLAEENRDGDRILVEILTEHVRGKMGGLTRPAVVLVDHGSPNPAVTAVRDRLGQLLQERLGNDVRCVRVASMERRTGEKYAFNEPLLAAVLDAPELAEENIVVALQFLLPGRHAGENGDIEKICIKAKKKHSQQITRPTSLVGEHPLLLELLTQRLKILEEEY